MIPYQERFPAASLLLTLLLPLIGLVLLFLNALGVAARPGAAWMTALSTLAALVAATALSARLRLAPRVALGAALFAFASLLVVTFTQEIPVYSESGSGMDNYSPYAPLPLFWILVGAAVLAWSSSQHFDRTELLPRHALEGLTSIVRPGAEMTALSAVTLMLVATVLAMAGLNGALAKGLFSAGVFTLVTSLYLQPEEAWRERQTALDETSPPADAPDAPGPG